MFESYKEIFNKRGTLYNSAMIDCPYARKNEFNYIIELAEISEGNLIIDIPSGGGYLINYIKPSVNVISVETSNLFVQDIQPKTNQSILLCNDISNTLFPVGCADRVISLAGLHHIEERLNFYSEIYRMVKPGGLFCIGDAYKNSSVASFLNIFVNQFNSMGHNGIFLSNEDVFLLKKVGFNIISQKIYGYTWDFTDADAMAGYCQKLFGMNMADIKTIQSGIQSFVGYKLDQHSCKMNWELFFIKAHKS